MKEATIKRALNSMFTLLIATLVCSVACAQDGNPYLVQPGTKVYTKFRNPLIKTTKPVTVIVVKGKAYLDGDIFLGRVSDLDAYQNSVQVQSITNDENVLNARWVNGIIPFVILPGFSEEDRAVIIWAMNNLAENTHVCFRPRTNESNYIKFKQVTKDELGYEGGHSELGRCSFCPDGQEIQMTPGVTKRTALHEICHALGLLHEQSREDRDTHVEILYDNIEFPLGLGGNFGQAVYTSTDVGSYDFKSIMHYRPTAFGKFVKGKQLQTIRRRSDPSDLSFGKGSSLSSGDIAGINSMYPTERNCSPLTILAPGELAVGESKTVNISAGTAHDLTGIYMRAGQQFEFRTTSPAWSNGSKATDCDGYEASVLDALRRHGDLKMMVLTGEIFEQNNSNKYLDHYFRIGCGPRTVTVAKTGFLVCFANDIITGYGDNSGIVALTVKRIL